MRGNKPSLFYGASAITFENAKKLRESMTTTERKLWEKLSKNQLGVRFKPQHPLSDYIVDFYCHKGRFVIEVDGDIHFNETKAEKDLERQKHLESIGLKVIRFTNEQVENDIDGVIGEIAHTLKERLYSSPL